IRSWTSSTGCALRKWPASTSTSRRTSAPSRNRRGPRRGPYSPRRIPRSARRYSALASLAVDVLRESGPEVPGGRPAAKTRGRSERGRSEGCAGLSRPDVLCEPTAASHNLTSGELPRRPKPPSPPLFRTIRPENRTNQRSRDGLGGRNERSDDRIVRNFGRFAQTAVQANPNGFQAAPTEIFLCEPADVSHKSAFQLSQPMFRLFQPVFQLLPSIFQLLSSIFELL